MSAMTAEEVTALEVLLDWLYQSEDSGWTCAQCGWGNGGSYRLWCKGSCGSEDEPIGRHPMADQIVTLWMALGRTYDADRDELIPPPEYVVPNGGRSPEPVQRWDEYVDRFR